MLAMSEEVGVVEKKKISVSAIALIILVLSQILQLQLMHTYSPKSSDHVIGTYRLYSKS